MQRPKTAVDNQHSDQKPILDVQFPKFNKLLEEGRGPQGDLLPPLEEEASVLVAVSPSYSYHFTKGSLQLETTLTEPKINALLSKNFGHSALLLGYGSTWTHFLIALAVSNTKPKLEELVSLETVELEAKRMAIAEEEKMHQNLLLQIKTNGKQLQNLKTSTGKESPPVILSSELKQAQTYFNKMLLVYDGCGVEGIEDKIKEFKNYVDLCINPAIKRFYQKNLLTPFSQNRIFCKIKDEKNEAYNLRALVKRMMVYHLLEEMSHFLDCINNYNVHYILHEGTIKRNVSHDQLIKIVIAMFLPDRIGLGNLQNIVFTPIKTNNPAKDLDLKSAPAPIAIPSLPTPSFPSVSAPIPKPTHDAKALSPKYDEDIAHSLSFDQDPTEMWLSDKLHNYIFNPKIKYILPMINSFSAEPESKFQELLLASVGEKDLDIVNDSRAETLYELYNQSSHVKDVLDLIVITLSLGIKYLNYVMKDIKKYIDYERVKNFFSNSEMKLVGSSDQGPKLQSHSLKPQQTYREGIRHSDNMHLLTKGKRSKSLSSLPDLENRSQTHTHKF